MSCMALEVCDGVTKAAWRPCAYSKYWLPKQEVRWLNDKYGNLEEEEASVRTRKRARIWQVG